MPRWLQESKGIEVAVDPLVVRLLEFESRTAHIYTVSVSINDW
jgi:hypothetical protein